MCEKKKKKKSDCEKSRENLERSIEQGNEKLCKMIGLLLSGRTPNLTPLDGDEKN